MQQVRQKNFEFLVIDMEPASADGNDAPGVADDALHWQAAARSLSAAPVASGSKHANSHRARNTKGSKPRPASAVPSHMAETWPAARPTALASIAAPPSKVTAPRGGGTSSTKGAGAAKSPPLRTSSSPRDALVSGWSSGTPRSSRDTPTHAPAPAPEKPPMARAKSLPHAKTEGGGAP